jgi:hypothetical protein
MWTSQLGKRHGHTVEPFLCLGSAKPFHHEKSGISRPDLKRERWSECSDEAYKQYRACEEAISYLRRGGRVTEKEAPARLRYATQI